MLDVLPLGADNGANGIRIRTAYVFVLVCLFKKVVVKPLGLAQLRVYKGETG